MDEQGKETPEIGGINSPSNWRAETLKEEPKQRQNLFQRLISRIRGEPTVKVSSDGGPITEMTQAEADAQAQAELQKAKSAAPPGAEVKLEDKGGGTQEVVTHIPDDQEGKKEVINDAEK